MIQTLNFSLIWIYDVCDTSSHLLFPLLCSPIFSRAGSEGYSLILNPGPLVTQQLAFSNPHKRNDVVDSGYTA